MKQSIVVVACLALGLCVSACGSNQNGNASAGTNQNGGQNGGQSDLTSGGDQMGGPGGSGKVAAVSGSTAQVQGQGGQVAVTWTAKTRFTQQVSAKASDLKVGDCVAAMPEMSASSGSSDFSKVTAATVRISTAVDGSCTNGMRGSGDGRRTDQTAPPEGAQEGTAPEGGAPDGGQLRRGAMGAFGKVTAVNGTGFTVESARPDSSDSTTVTVTTSSDTTWTRTAKATSKDVKVGRCVASIGKSDSTGAITAASIAVSQPVDGQCTVMFGRPGRGPGNGDQDGEAQSS